MNKPYFLIETYLDLYKNNINELKKNLYKQNIHCKEDENLLLIYNKFDTNIKSDLCRECRSLIVDKLTMNIISYTCETPLKYNDNIIVNNNSIITECYEGTMLSLFYYKDKWILSNRKSINSKNSIINNKSYFDLFEDVIINSGYESFNSFTNILDESQSYYFNLIHHLNKNIIDYSNKFGINYKYLCLSSVKDHNLNELDIHNLYLSFLSNYIFISKPIESLDKIINDNYKMKYNYKPVREGIIIKTWNYQYNKYNLYKLLFKNYEYFLALEYNNNLYNGLLYLYQNNELNKYLKYNPIFSLINSYNSKDVINNLFKVLTSEILEIFKIIINSNKLHKLLPYEYKNLIFELKLINYNNYNLTLFTVYSYIKSISTINLINIIKKRHEVLEIKEFKNISSFCDKLQLEHCDLYINKL